MMLDKERIAVILQPSFLPWLGYFSQMYRSDVFVVYDNTQYDKESWRNRNRIKTRQGVQWLTVPVLTKSQNWPLNLEVKIDNGTNWKKKHWQSISQNYSKAPYFNLFRSTFESLYTREWENLIDLNMAFFNTLCDLLGLKREILFASDLDISGDRLERLIQICNKVGANVFHEGAAGKNYIDENQFAQAGIRLEYQNYQHPVYPQLHGEFIPYLSVIDLLFNCGTKSLEVIVK